MSLFKANCLERISKRIMRIDSNSQHAEESKKDWILVVIIITGLGTLLCPIPLYLKLVVDKGLEAIFYIDLSMVCYLTTLHSTMLKHLVAKRLSAIRRSRVSSDSVVQLISATRQVLDCNSILNTESAAIITITLFNTFFHTINFGYSSWIIYGAGKEFPEAWENYPFLTIFANIGVFSPSILLCSISSSVADEETIYIGIVELSSNSNYAKFLNKDWMLLIIMLLIGILDVEPLCYLFLFIDPLFTVNHSQFLLVDSGIISRIISEVFVVGNGFGGSLGTICFGPRRVDDIVA
ncbi:hypothetical protein J6590_074818 [Homalodisca vitripennis]|nr:hypothetical protein J6590_074818 [Homalodisca vitripennis]